MDDAGRGAALSVRRSGWDAGPRGKRLEASRSAVQRCYSTAEGTWGSGSLRQGSKEHVTSWSVTTQSCVHLCLSKQDTASMLTRHFSVLHKYTNILHVPV
jgi:hypothetical protein